MRIGTLKIHPPYILAPMAGVTDLAFRLICKAEGAGLVCTEMVSANALIHGGRKHNHILDLRPEAEAPVSVQLFGPTPEIMAEGLKRLVHLPVDVFDINMGCPVPKIAGQACGSALLKDPPRAASLVKAMVGITDRPVTVKIRSGWDEKSVNAVEVALRLQDAGAASVAIHGRTRAQGYKGTADWDIIAAVVEALDIPVSGSGDVFTARDVVGLQMHTRCAGVHFARGALGHPWLFREAIHLWETGADLPPPTLRERFVTMRTHFALLRQTQGEHTANLKFRKHGAWYTKGLPGSAQVRAELNRALHADAALAVLDRYEAALRDGEHAGAGTRGEGVAA